MERRGISVPKECQILKFGMMLKRENREKSINIFSKLLNKRFLKLDFDYNYRFGIQLDNLILKVNKRYKNEFLKATIRILENLECSNFIVTDSKFYSIVSCITPFGERKIFSLYFGYDNGYQHAYENSVIGFRLVEATKCGVLNFKDENGGLSAVIGEDFTKHYDLVKHEILKISKEFEIFSFMFATTYI